jgi:hypothetical protein
VRKPEALKVDTTWQRTDSLKTLVDRTHPQLAQVPERGVPTDTELRALLLALKEKSDSAVGRVTTCFVVVAIVGGFLSLPIFWFMTSGGSNATLATVIAVPVLLYVGVYVCSAIARRRERRELAEDALSEACEKHRIDLDRLLELARQSPEPLGIVVDVVADALTESQSGAAYCPDVRV